MKITAFEGIAITWKMVTNKTGCLLSSFEGSSELDWMAGLNVFRNLLSTQMFLTHAS